MYITLILTIVAVIALFAGGYAWHCKDELNTTRRGNDSLRKLLDTAGDEAYALRESVRNKTDELKLLDDDLVLAKEAYSRLKRIFLDAANAILNQVTEHDGYHQRVLNMVKAQGEVLEKVRQESAVVKFTLDTLVDNLTVDGGPGLIPEVQTYVDRSREILNRDLGVRLTLVVVAAMDLAEDEVFAPILAELAELDEQG